MDRIKLYFTKKHFIDFCQNYKKYFEEDRDLLDYWIKSGSIYEEIFVFFNIVGGISIFAKTKNSEDFEVIGQYARSDAKVVDFIGKHLGNVTIKLLDPKSPILEFGVRKE